MVNDFHALLQAAAIPAPHVLVGQSFGGQSFGGLLVRLYAHHHPGKVAGLVLVASMHEDQFDIFGPIFPPAAPSDPSAFAAMRAFWQDGWRNPDSTTEGIDFPSSIRQGKEIPSLGDVPLHIIIAGTMLNQSMMPAPVRAALQQQWQELQMRFLRLSTRATHSLELSSGHIVQRDNPKAVADAIKAAVRAFRREP